MAYAFSKSHDKVLEAIEGRESKQKGHDSFGATIDPSWDVVGVDDGQNSQVQREQWSKRRKKTHTPLIHASTHEGGSKTRASMSTVRVHGRPLIVRLIVKFS
jgi:hypothetical protein